MAEFELEWFDPALGAPSISVAEYGLTFNKAAVDIIGDAPRVMLGFSKDRKLIGVKPLWGDLTPEEEKKSFAFAEKKRDNYIRIASKEFVRFISRHLPEVSFEKTIRYLAVWDDSLGMLLADLNRPIETGSNE